MDACRVSMVTQRLVHVERKLRLEAEALAAERAQEAERLKGELTVLQVAAIGFCTILLLTCRNGCNHMACTNDPHTCKSAYAWLAKSLCSAIAK